MNILFIVRGYPSERYKTHGIFEYDMAKALADKGHSVTYVTVDTRSLRRRRKLGHESFVRDGIHIEAINIPLGRIYNPLKTKISEWFLLKNYEKLRKKYGAFDVIHSHFIDPSYLAAKLKHKTGIPLVVTEHSSKLNTGLSPYINKKLIFAYSMADQLTTVSKALASVIEKQFGVTSKVIPNIVDTEIFTPKKEYKGAPPYRFVTTGNLISGKGMDITIEAFSKLVEKYPECELWIFGQGPEKENLIKLIKTLRLEDTVFMKGLVSRKALSEAYEYCDFFVLASHSETFGVAYIEALSKGIPVIATDCGGPSEFVNENNGIIVPVNDTETLYESMQMLIRNRDHYDSELISEEIRRYYSPRNNAALLESIYKEVSGSE